MHAHESSASSGVPSASSAQSADVDHSRVAHPPDAHPRLLVVGLGVLLVGVLLARWAYPLRLGEEIDVDAAAVARVEQRIDPNVASWPELARLPRVGETLARRIVAYRETLRDARRGEAHAARTGSADEDSPDPVGAARAPVFRTPADLDAVRGIGPRTLERLTPYLVFPDEAAP